MNKLKLIKDLENYLADHFPQKDINVSDLIIGGNDYVVDYLLYDEQTIIQICEDNKKIPIEVLNTLQKYGYKYYQFSYKMLNNKCYIEFI